MKQSKRIQNILLVLFFFSGACGLIYEVVWQRMLSLVFGNTTYATTTIVASFMGGMALGAFYLGRIVDKHKNPLKLYAYLEAGTGVFAILFPFILSAISAMWAGIANYFPSFYVASLVKFGISFIVLLVPAFLMGGTLPVISKFFIQKFDRLGGGVGSLYGINTLGGVIGAFLAAFFMFTWLGVKETAYITAGINIVIAGIVLWLNKSALTKNLEEKVPQKTRKRKTNTVEPTAYPPNIYRIVLIVYAVAGFCSLAYEILWTRVLVFFLGSATTVFTTMLTTFLLGLALGGLIFGRFFDKSKNPLSLLAFIEVFIGLTALLSVWEFSKLWGILQSVYPALGGGWGGLIGTRYAGALLVMFLPTLLIGMAFPLVNRIYARDLTGIGHGIGYVYSANTLGCIIGSFVASFVLVPLMGITKSIMLVASINLVLGAVVAFTSFSINKIKWTPAVSSVVLVAVLAATFAVPTSKLQRVKAGQELVFYKEGSSSTVAVLQGADGVKELTVNSVSEVPTTYNALRTFHMLGSLPFMLQKDPQKALVVSFGAGIASGAVATHSLKQIDVVEISPEVIDANKFFLEENQNVLADPRVNLIIDDGRNYLLRTKTQYDVITSDATHPIGGDSWVLYTKEFYELASARLTEDGIMSQWLPVHYLAPQDYKMIINTFQSVFPDTTLWYTNEYTILLGAKKELKIDYALLEQKFQDKRVQEDLARFNLGDPVSFLTAFVMGKEALDRYTRRAEINTDDLPLIQSAERRTGVITSPRNLLELEGSMESIYPLLTNMGDQAGALKAKLDNALEAQKHVINGQIYYFGAMPDEQIAEYQKAVEINPDDTNARRLLELAQQRPR